MFNPITTRLTRFSDHRRGLWRGISSFTHIYHAGYGGPEVDQTAPEVKSVKLSADGLVATIELSKLKLGHVHEFDLGALRSRDKEDLLHRNAYYTVNAVPKDK